MATDGPGLMQGDAGSEFCDQVYKSIDNLGRLNIDELLRKDKKYEADRKRVLDEEGYRLHGEFIEVLITNRVKQEMWSCYNWRDEADPNGYIFNKLKTVTVSKQTLQEILLKLEGYLLEYIDPVLSWKVGYGKFGVNFDRAVNMAKHFGSADRYEGKPRAENKAITPVLERLAKEPVTTLEQARSHRKQIMTLYTKAKLVGCSIITEDSLRSMLNHGWVKEEYYQDMVKHIMSNIVIIKRILETPEEQYIIYNAEPHIEKPHPKVDGLKGEVNLINHIFKNNRLPFEIRIAKDKETGAKVCRVYFLPQQGRARFVLQKQYPQDAIEELYYSTSGPLKSTIHIALIDYNNYFSR